MMDHCPPPEETCQSVIAEDWAVRLPRMTTRRGMVAVVIAGLLKGGVVGGGRDLSRVIQR